jgi:hypothetical protein
LQVNYDNGLVYHLSKACLSSHFILFFIYIWYVWSILIHYFLNESHTSLSWLSLWSSNVFLSQVITFDNEFVFFPFAFYRRLKMILPFMNTTVSLMTTSCIETRYKRVSSYTLLHKKLPPVPSHSKTKQITKKLLCFSPLLLKRGCMV